MEHINSLKMYKQYLSAGYTDEQAIAAVEVLNSSFDSALEHVATKDDLKILEKDLKIFFGYLVGGTFVLAFIIPLAISAVAKHFGW